LETQKVPQRKNNWVICLQRINRHPISWKLKKVPQRKNKWVIFLQRINRYLMSWKLKKVLKEKIVKTTRSSKNNSTTNELETQKVPQRKNSWVIFLQRINRYLMSWKLKRFSKRKL
jgi:hypothetical protein